jgi:hypothetical protein
MLRPTTHFEQVSLEVVRKIVDGQIRGEIAAEQDTETGQKKSGATATKATAVDGGRGQS